MAFKICMIGTQFIGVPADSGGAIEYLSFNIAEGISKKFEDVGNYVYRFKNYELENWLKEEGCKKNTVKSI